jgi:hypothetical protein
MIKILHEELRKAEEREEWLKNQLEAALKRIEEIEKRIPLALPERAGFFARFFKK